MRDARRSQTNFGAFFVWRFVAVKRPARPPRLFTRRAVRAAPPPHVALFVAPRSSRSRHVPSCREKPKMPNVGRWKLSPRAVPDTRAAGAFSRRRSRPTSHKPMRKQGQLAPHFCKVHHMRVLGGSGAGRRRPRAPQKPRLLRGIAPPMKEVGGEMEATAVEHSEHYMPDVACSARGRPGSCAWARCSACTRRRRSGCAVNFCRRAPAALHSAATSVTRGVRRCYERKSRPPFWRGPRLLRVALRAGCRRSTRPYGATRPLKKARGVFCAAVCCKQKSRPPMARPSWPFAPGVDGPHGHTAQLAR